MSEEADYIEDPEALRRAEEAVARADTPFDHPMAAPIDESWVRIARQTGEVIVGGLRDVADSLGAAGIPMGWDPYDPRESPSFMPPIVTLVGRTFSIAVPASRVSDARDVLAGPAPDGVTYSWDAAMSEAGQAMGEDAERARQRDAEAGREIEPALADRAPAGVMPVTGADPRLSDNARLSEMARGGGSGLTIAVVSCAVLLAIAALVFLLLRG